jgi:hypothetical protein
LSFSKAENRFQSRLGYTEKRRLKKRFAVEIFRAVINIEPLDNVPTAQRIQACARLTPLEIML